MAWNKPEVNNISWVRAEWGGGSCGHNEEFSVKRHKVPHGKRGKGKDDEEEPRTELSYVANLRRTSPSVKAAKPPLFRKSGELESQWAWHGELVWCFRQTLNPRGGKVSEEGPKLQARLWKFLQLTLRTFRVRPCCGRFLYVTSRYCCLFNLFHLFI